MGTMGTSERDHPFAASKLFIACPKCGSEARLMSSEKFPEFRGEIRIYECGSCGHKKEVVSPD
jgi:C4-type Zn-finger protein